MNVSEYAEKCEEAWKTYESVTEKERLEVAAKALRPGDYHSFIQDTEYVSEGW